MYIQSATIEPRTVDDYDFTFTNGLFMTVTVDKDAGDTIDYDTSPLTTIFHLTQKASPTDSKVTAPAEDVTVFLPHVLSIQHRTRSVMPIAAEQKDEFQRILYQMGKSIN